MNKFDFYLTYFRVENVMAGIDFNPDGETVATIDRYGTCLISDMNTDKYHFHMKMEMEGSQGKLER